MCAGLSACAEKQPVQKRFAACVLLSLAIAGCSKDPEHATQRFIARGDEFARNGRDEAAVLEFRNALKSSPGRSETYLKLGDAYARLGRTTEAYRAYTEGSRIVDGQPLPQSEDALQSILDQHPNLVSARIALAELLLARRDADDAQAQLEAATVADPGNELANRSLAALYVSNGRKDAAERCLRAAAAHEPNRYRSRLALADFLMTERRYDEARTWLERARQDRQLERAVATRLAAIDYEQGQVAPAERAVSDLLKTGGSAEIWTLQAQFLYRDGKPEEALAAAREALALDRDLVPAQNLVDAIRRNELWR